MGKPLFRKTGSRYRLLDGKWCVAARKTAQSAKTRSRLVNGDELELEDSQDFTVVIFYYLCGRFLKNFVV